MYNPSSDQADDHDAEWIELYNNGTSTIDLTNWKIDNKNFDDVNISAGEYLIIARELIDGNDADNASFESYWGNNDGIWNSSDGNYTAIDGPLSLGNSEDTINLSNDSYSAISSYNKNLGADGNGYTLEWINGKWMQSSEYGGTPGRENTATDTPQIPDADSGLKISVILESPLYIGFTYTKLFKIQNLDHVTGQTDHIDATVNYNISGVKEDAFEVIGLNSFKTANTGSFKPSSEGNFIICGEIISSTVENDPKIDNIACETVEVINPFTVPCNVSINVTTEKTIYNNSETIKFYNNLNNESFPYIIEYWIGDLLGEVFKKKINTTNTNVKSYTPKIGEKDRVLLIKNKVYQFCNDTSLLDNEAEKLVIITNKGGTSSLLSSNEKSSLKIEKLLDVGSDDKVKFGESFRVNLNIYKGNTAKRTIKVWVEDSNGKKVGKESKTNVKGKYISYDITLPIQLPPNCNGKLKNGEYKVITEGLGEKDQEKVEIEDIIKSLCEGAKEKNDPQKPSPKKQKRQ